MNPLVSVIVPVYKVEKELPDCIQSIIDQTYQNLEIILVDDGSPDNCGKICEEYAKKDHRIKVIHKKNEGQSAARNVAISISKGEYIVCVDSDDIARNIYVETLLDLLIKYNSDMVISPYQKFFDKNELFVDSEIKIESTDNKEALKRLLYQDKVYHTGPHSKIFKKSLFENIEFPVGLYYEDLATVYRLMMKSNSIVSTTQVLYGYRIRQNSTMRQSYSKKMLSCIPVSRKLYEDISTAYPELRKAAASRAFSVNRAIFWQIPSEYKNERNQVWTEMKKYRKIVLGDKEARKREKLIAFFSYFGKGPMSMLSRAYQKQQMGLN